MNDDFEWPYPKDGRAPWADRRPTHWVQKLGFSLLAVALAVAIFARCRREPEKFMHVTFPTGSPQALPESMAPYCIEFAWRGCPMLWCQDRPMGATSAGGLVSLGPCVRLEEQ